MRVRTVIVVSVVTGLALAGGAGPVGAAAHESSWGGGRVVAGGRSLAGEGRVPVDAEPAKAIGVGDAFSVALRRDGRVVAWGQGGGGTDVPPGLGRVRQVAVAGSQVVALRRSGTVAAWGARLDYGEQPVNPAVEVPDGLKGVIDVATGASPYGATAPSPRGAGTPPACRTILGARGPRPHRAACRA